MSHQVGHAAVPLSDPTPRQLAQAINLATDGKLNSVGGVTLTENVTTTVLLDKRMGVDSVLLFIPTSANAAAIIASIYVSSKGKETATITHTSDANTDKTYDYIIIG